MSRPLHIAFFNRAFYPEASATGQLLTDLTEGLALEYGCKVSVVTGVPQGKPVSGPPPGGVSILRAWGTNWPKNILPGRISNYLTYFVSACGAGLKLDPPDVIISLTDPPIIGLAALLAARRFRCPLVVAYQDIFPEVTRLLEDSRSRLFEWPLQRVNKTLIRRADRLIVIGEAMQNRLVREKGADPAKISIIPNWVDTSQIVPAPRKNRFSESNGLSNRFVVMHSGNMGASQNLEMLLETAAKLQSVPDILFVFMGDGIRREALRAEADRRGIRNVLFLPHQPKESLSEAFGSADCFIVSLKPGLAGYIMPSKLYGILASGRPYVASVDEDCDVAKVTREHRCGLAVRAGQVEELCKGILTFHRDRALAEQMGENGRRAAMLFDRSVAIKAYYDLCLRLVSHWDISATL